MVISDPLIQLIQAIRTMPINLIRAMQVEAGILTAIYSGLKAAGITVSPAIQGTTELVEYRFSVISQSKLVQEEIHFASLLRGAC